MRVVSHVERAEKLGRDAAAAESVGNKASGKVKRRKGEKARRRIKQTFSLFYFLTFPFL